MTVSIPDPKATNTDLNEREVVLSVDELSKRYGHLQAVDAVSFQVSRGETFGLLGPNGAGKTTTLEMIEGLRQPDSGRITLLGLDAVRRRRDVQERIGVQLQSQALWPELTVEETLLAFRSLFRTRAPIDPLIDRLSLEDKRRSLVKSLSGGQKQRLSIATALVNKPDVVFLDEPTTGLDPQARRSFWDLIKALEDEDETVIITTHYMEEAEVLCDRVAIMDKGRIIAIDTPRNLILRFASDSTVECEFARPVEPAALAALPGVREVRAENGGVLLFTNDASSTLSALMDLCTEVGLPIPRLNVRSATLEDVFIALTGRRLRD
jgi:ABC-2 type transport system ATP-binding protein